MVFVARVRWRAAPQRKLVLVVGNNILRRVDHVVPHGRNHNRGSAVARAQIERRMCAARIRIWRAIARRRAVAARARVAGRGKQCRCGGGRGAHCSRGANGPSKLPLCGHCVGRREHLGSLVRGHNREDLHLAREPREAMAALRHHAALGQDIDIEQVHCARRDENLAAAGRMRERSRDLGDETLVHGGSAFGLDNHLSAVDAHGLADSGVVCDLPNLVAALLAKLGLDECLRPAFGLGKLELQLQHAPDGVVGPRKGHKEASVARCHFVSLVRSEQISHRCIVLLEQLLGHLAVPVPELLDLRDGGHCNRHTPQRRRHALDHRVNAVVLLCLAHVVCDRGDFLDLAHIELAREDGIDVVDVLPESLEPMGARTQHRDPNVVLHMWRAEQRHGLRAQNLLAVACRHQCARKLPRPLQKVLAAIGGVALVGIDMGFGGEMDAHAHTRACKHNGLVVVDHARHCADHLWVPLRGHDLLCEC
eukprot:comp22005_c0_seq1/m.50525 comp22005_c0_seq1/g.50525  ORF comp22005_c0_seq1/g.50525 comp22005_c0_seq1/m.50525 type:complete len:479 (+) comp22005_c0_seq1:1135-2571(+)